MSLLKLAALILYTFPGSPMLYYGDEAGMQGFEDPFNRGTYPWGRENQELVRYFQQLGALRKAHEALQIGTIVYHAAQGRALAFSRRTEHDHCLTAVNAGDRPVMLTLLGRGARRGYPVASGILLRRRSPPPGARTLWHDAADRAAGVICFT